MIKERNSPKNTVAFVIDENPPDYLSLFASRLDVIINTIQLFMENYDNV